MTVEEDIAEKLRAGWRLWFERPDGTRAHCLWDRWNPVNGYNTSGGPARPELEAYRVSRDTYRKPE
jgi:hypothetical protein